ncbi:hypothetical protein ACTJIJ_19930 [Niabella sp. 22666]|uniref:hypothetical protein n=1 Tax=Niabella sp. 22666 TaxID=3453954 RepID=UPI003F8463AF
MKYPKLSAAAKATQEFEAVNEGTWLTDAQLQNTEAALAAGETALNEAQTNLAAANDTITAHATTIAANTTTIADLQQQLAAAKNAPAAGFEEKEKENETQSKGATLSTPTLDAAFGDLFG